MILRLFFSFALRDGVVADGNFILKETKESRPPSDADPGEKKSYWEIVNIIIVNKKYGPNMY